MKTFIQKSLLISLLALSITTIASAQTTICFDLKISDNCSGEWNGYYTARVSVLYLGSNYCVHTFYNLSTGTTNDLSYSCSDLPLDYLSPVYTVAVTVCRQEENPECCGSDQNGTWHYYELDDCSIDLDVTLSD